MGPTEGDVFELRVHGVSGTVPEVMLSEAFPRPVAGDDVARFFRKSAPVGTRSDAAGATRQRRVEAFHWGRFTAGSPSRALWLLLMPFTLLNLSRYCLLFPGAGDRRRSARTAEAVLRLLGLVMTLTLLVNVSYAGLELVANQCATSVVCRQDNGWLDAVADRPFGLLLLLLVLPPISVVAVVWWFGRQTFLYDPPGALRHWRPADGSFADPAFWHTSPKAPMLRALHVAGACAVLGLLLVAIRGSRGHVRWDHVALDRGLLAVGGLLLAAATVMVARAPEHPLHAPAGRADAVAPPRSAAALRWIAAGYLVATVALDAWSMWQATPLPLRRGTRQPPLAGFELAANLASAAAGLLLVVLAITCVALRRSPRGRALTGAGIPPAFRPFWRGYAAVVVAAVAVVLAVGYSSGLAFRVADVLGRPVAATTGSARDVAEACGCDVRHWGLELAASYWTASRLWGSLVIGSLLLLLPALSAAMFRRTWAAGALLVAAGCAVGAWQARGAAAVAWGLASAGALGVGAGCWAVGWRGDGFAAAAAADYPAGPLDPLDADPPDADPPDADPPDADAPVAPRGLTKIVRAWRLAATKYRYHWPLGLFGAAGFLAVVVAAAAGVSGAGRVGHAQAASVGWRWPGWTATLPDLRLPGLPSEVGSIGTWALSGFALVVVVLGTASWRGEKMRIAVGIVWDLLSFWPRIAHPMCPPPYGGRATLEVARRARTLANEGGAGAVILSGHSQGSVICVAAVAVLDHAGRQGDGPPAAAARRTVERLGLVTYGSQLQFAYPRMFPSFVGYAHLQDWHDRALRGRWRSVFRWTDPLGGPVLTWPAAGTAWPTGIGVPAWRGFAPVDGVTEVRAGTPDDDAVGFRAGHDVRLRDPETVADSWRRPRSPLRGHGGYYDDPVFDEVVVELAGAVALQATALQATALQATAAPATGRPPAPGDRTGSAVWRWLRRRA